MPTRIALWAGPWLFAALATAGEEPGTAAAAAEKKEADRPGEDWPMWGGAPGRNMVNTAEKGIAASWDVETGRNIKWKAGLGSRSYGNTVVAGGKVFVGTNNERLRNPDIKGDKGVLMCFRESDGAFLWQAIHDKLPAGRVNDWPEEGICSSPCVEGGRVYYVSNRCELVCADVNGFLDGKNDGPYREEKYHGSTDADFIWVLDMIEELSVFPHNMAASSPLIAGDLVFIVTGNGVDESHVTIPQPDAPSFVAVDKNTGKVVWEDRSPNPGILHGQWSSPACGVLAGVPQVLFGGGDGRLYSFEPLTGKPLWKFDLNPPDAKWDLGGKGTKNNIIATPVIADGRVFLASGEDPEHGEGVGHIYAIDPAAAFPPRAAEGDPRPVDITATGLAWHRGDKDFRRSLSTAAVLDGLVYAANLSGYLQCLDEKTGEPRWTHDLFSAVWGSPTVIDGKVYIGDEDGDVLVFAVGREKKLLARNPMPSGVLGTPVAAHGVLYVADRTTLYAIEEKR